MERRRILEPFQRFTAERPHTQVHQKTVETVQIVPTSADTHLKVGVNEIRYFTTL
jgi:hypothetical protein